VKDLSVRAAEKIKYLLVNKSTFVSFEEDSWSRFGRQYTAITAGSQGDSAFVGCFDIESGVETATVRAAAINRCMLSALGLDPDLGKHHGDIPRGKIAGMTSDTTNVMPATAKALLGYDLFKDMIWTPCSDHTLSLFIQDQMIIPPIKVFLQKANDDVTFKDGQPRKLFLMHTTDGTGTIEQGVKTRWGSYSRSCESLLKRKAALESAVQDADFLRIAGGHTRHRAMGEEDLSYDDESMPRSWQGHGKYTSVYAAVRDVGFWIEAKEYVSMNKSVCAAISMLRSDSALCRTQPLLC
jgi:hypothetical protein